MSRSQSVSQVRLNDILTLEQYADEKVAFIQHLVTEFSIENFLFFQDARIFHDRFLRRPHTATEIGRKALEIFFKFVDSGAPYQVNLKHGVVRDLELTLKECITNFDSIAEQGYFGRKNTVNGRLKPIFHEIVPCDVFEPARDSIYRLMESDSYVRWKIALQTDEEPGASAQSTPRSSVRANAKLPPMTMIMRATPTNSNRRQIDQSRGAAKDDGSIGQSVEDLIRLSPHQVVELTASSETRERHARQASELESGSGAVRGVYGTGLSASLEGSGSGSRRSSSSDAMSTLTEVTAIALARNPVIYSQGI